MYVGGIDKVHNLEQLLNASEILLKEGIQDIKIVIHGMGKAKKQLQNETIKRCLTNIIWKDVIKKQDVPDKLNQADVLFLSTSKVLYGSENKLYEYLAIGKPLICAVYGSHNDPVAKIDCGISVEPDNPEKLARAIIQLYNTPSEQLYAMGKKGREYMEKNHDIKHFSMQLETLLQEVICKYG